MELGIKILQQNDLSKSFVFSPFFITAAVEILKNLPDGNGNVHEDTQNQEFNKNGFGWLAKRKNGNKIVHRNHVFCRNGNSLNLNPESKLKGLANVSSVDFQDKEIVCKIINDTIPFKPNEKPKEFVKPRDISENLKIFTTPFIQVTPSFRCASMLYPRIAKKTFNKRAGVKRTIDFLHVSNKARMNENEYFHVVSSNSMLGSNFTFSAIEPKIDFGLKKFMKYLNWPMLEKLITTGPEHYVNFMVPKVEEITNFGFDKVANALGIKSEDKAFGMASTASVKFGTYHMTPGTWAFKTGHPAFENGSLDLNTPYEEPKYTDFIVNQPFVYVISKDQKPLIMGYFN